MKLLAKDAGLCQNLCMNPASITDMMSDDLDITEVVVLDHITAILYVGHD